MTTYGGAIDDIAFIIDLSKLEEAMAMARWRWHWQSGVAQLVDNCWC